ncbi:MAG: type II toxin-antitoxin system PemK/MazF family toxin [Lachnospiraceae bacterium]|nr:type II toxin-antitoxin system PemK/MazF family toxin [Lachnospiraceae bacterium]MCM1236352.1 type II toxin-antitoxin system PemK/MazF family toxin [Ruminococcus flavefaciens]
MNFQSKERMLHIGDVYLMRFTGGNNEQNGWRPGLVFQNNTGNLYSPNIIALPLTSSIKKVDQPTHVVIKASDSGLRKDSMVLCENPERMSKNNIGQYITTLSDNYMKKIAIASVLATSIISYLDADVLLSAWKRSLTLNAIAVSA